MSYRVKVDGTDSFEIETECVEGVDFTLGGQLDSNAKTKDVGSTLVITGRILTAVDGDPFDSTRKLALWSAVPAEKADSYRKVTVEHVTAGIMVRKYYFPNAFVIEYYEKYDVAKGTGIFTLTIKQKKDKIANLKVEGGYPAA